MARYCDTCGHRRATRSTTDLPEIVKDEAARVCDDCWADLIERAAILGEPVGSHS